MTYLELLPGPRQAILAMAASLPFPRTAAQVVQQVLGNPRRGVEVSPQLWIAAFPGTPPLGIAYRLRVEDGYPVVTLGGIYTLGDLEAQREAVVAAENPGEHEPASVSFPRVVHVDEFTQRLPAAVRDDLVAELMADRLTDRQTFTIADDHLTLVTDQLGTGILVTELEGVLIVFADDRDSAALERGLPRRVEAAARCAAVREELTQLLGLLRQYHRARR